jgi:hypothetical protein
MKKLIANIPFCSNRHYDCVYVVLDSLLRFYQYEPALPCFHNWDFIYRPDEGEEFDIQGRAIPLPNMLKAFAITPFIGSTNDQKKAWREVKNLIDTNIPVAVSIDVFSLAQAGLYPRLRHSDHQNILSGYDEQADTVHLVDPSPWQPSARDIPLDLFFSCWDISAIPRKAQDRYNWAWLQVPAQRPPFHSAHAYTILQDNLNSMSVSSDQAHLVSGLEGIERLAEDTAAWAQYENQFLQERLKQCAQLLLEIAMLREGYGCFLGHVSQVCNFPGLATLSREFESIAQSWFVVKNLCFKGTVKKATDVVPRIQSRLYAIAAKERMALATLAEMTDALGDRLGRSPSYGSVTLA